MAKTKVFYSFHFDNDVMRTQLVRNIGALESNQPVEANDWETVKKKGDKAIEDWIDSKMKDCDCVVVLVGEKTSERPWVKHEIKKAWNDKKGLLAIHVNDLKDPNDGVGKKGKNPLDHFTYKRNGASKTPPCITPKASDAYNDIKNNIEDWISDAIKISKG
ncbi:hypothetical protein CFII64_15577 [Pseudomonas sp. CFII64]|uniref:TIR domain-containing protein n=1 Tax=Pseudomonas sp. CFII64 TaxID=911242 RepID=UPI0003582C93|nr:TIR domain-containing protein [Pseudomonas sp. CFII64]EPJ82188.1 hypothetical protein CFII64_15577 [Pseudomonas sp. CFII64]